MLLVTTPNCKTILSLRSHELMKIPRNHTRFATFMFLIFEVLSQYDDGSQLQNDKWSTEKMLVSACTVNFD